MTSRQWKGADRRLIGAYVGGGSSYAAAGAAAGNLRCRRAEQIRHIFVAYVDFVASLRGSHTGFASE